MNYPDILPTLSSRLCVRWCELYNVPLQTLIEHYWQRLMSVEDEEDYDPLPPRWQTEHLFILINSLVFIRDENGPAIPESTLADQIDASGNPPPRLLLAYSRLRGDMGCERMP